MSENQNTNDMAARGSRLPTPIGSEFYRPEMVIIRKDWLYYAQESLREGIEAMQEELYQHDSNYRRELPRHKREAEDVERKIKRANENLRLLTDFEFSHFQNVEAVDLDRLVRLSERWEARIRDTPERARAGGVEYIGGLIDAYGTCFRELREIIEANDKRRNPEQSQETNEDQV